MRYQQIWIDEVHLVDQHFKHLTLIREDLNVGVCLPLSQLCLKIVGKRLLVKLAQECEATEFVFLGRPVLIHFVLDNAGNHGDLVGVVTVSRSLDRESEGDKWWCWLIQVFDGAIDIFGVINNDLMLGPTAAMICRTCLL